MLAIIDIDCTLYSYFELFQAAFFQSRLDGENRLSLEKEEGGRFWRRAADRAFLRSGPHIQERARLAAALFNNRARGGEKPLFYTSYPLTKVKKSLLSPLPIHLLSSFPKKKTAAEALRFCKRPPDLVIGDRKEDRDLARAAGAVWRGFPFYDFHHLLRGAAYTKALLSLIEEGAAAVRSGKSAKPTGGPQNKKGAI